MATTRYHLVRTEWLDINDPHRFVNTRTATEERSEGAEVLNTIDEAVDRLYEVIREVIKGSPDPEATAQMAGLAEDEDWERRMDVSRALLEAGKYAGRGTRRLPGSASTDVFVYPVTR